MPLPRPARLASQVRDDLALLAPLVWAVHAIFHPDGEGFCRHSAGLCTIAQKMFLPSTYHRLRTAEPAATCSVEDMCGMYSPSHLRHAGPASEVTEGSSGEAASVETAAQAAAAIKPQHKLLPDVCRTADILVVAVGHAELVRGLEHRHMVLMRVAAG